MTQKVLLVGHCGADSSYMRMAVRAADPEVQIVTADDQAELLAAVEKGVDLALVNRELYGFDHDSGVELIRSLCSGRTPVKAMLISNHADAQAEAVAAGATSGFGKREIGSRRVVELLRAALGQEDKPIA